MHYIVGNTKVEYTTQKLRPASNQYLLGGVMFKQKKVMRLGANRY
jgi:hypothetical protein